MPPIMPMYTTMEQMDMSGMPLQQYMMPENQMNNQAVMMPWIQSIPTDPQTYYAVT